MKDFLGKEIEIGDTIVVAVKYGTYSELYMRLGVVIEFTNNLIWYSYLSSHSKPIEEKEYPDKVVVVKKAAKFIGTGQPPANSQAVREAEEVLRSKKP